jgi:hypothetical protein
MALIKYSEPGSITPSDGTIFQGEFFSAYKLIYMIKKRTASKQTSLPYSLYILQI